MNNNNYIELYRSFGHLNKQLHRIAVNSIDDEGLHPSQARLLKIVHDNDGLTQKELADILFIRPASLTHLILKLEEAGYIERKENPADRRSTLVYITESGKQKALAIGEQRKDFTELLFSVLDAEEQTELLKLLNKLQNEWQHISEEQTDYFIYFLMLLHRLDSEEIKELLEEYEIEYEEVFDIFNKYPEAGKFGRGMCEPHMRGAGRGAERAESHPCHHHGAHPEHRRAHPQSRGQHHGRHGGHSYYHSHGYREESGRMRRNIIRSGYDFEGLREQLESVGLTEDVLKRIFEQDTE